MKIPANERQGSGKAQVNKEQQREDALKQHEDYYIHFTLVFPTEYFPKVNLFHKTATFPGNIWNIEQNDQSALMRDIQSEALWVSTCLGCQGSDVDS